MKEPRIDLLEFLSSDQITSSILRGNDRAPYIENINLLEEFLWLLYNPLGYCEQCGHSWDDLSCTCRSCEYDELTNEDPNQVINEPCGNVCVCVCDYFDGKPKRRDVSEFITELFINEFSTLEKGIYKNWKINKLEKSRVIEFIKYIISTKPINTKGFIDFFDGYYDYLNLKENFFDPNIDYYSRVETLIEFLDNYCDSYRSEILNSLYADLNSYYVSEYNKEFLKLLRRTPLEYREFLLEEFSKYKHKPLNEFFKRLIKQ